MSISQTQMYYAAQRRAADMDALFMEFVRGDNGEPLTRSELQKLIDKRPSLYGKYRGFLATLKD